MLRQHDTRIDASTIGSPTVGDHSTRFDYEVTRRDDQIRKDIDRKREVCFIFKLNNHFNYITYSLFRVEQIVGKKQFTS